MNKVPRFLAILAIAAILCGVAIGCEKAGEESQAPTATPLPLTPIATRTYTPTPQKLTEKELKSEITAMGIRKVDGELEHKAGECAVGEEAYIALRITNNSPVKVTEVKISIGTRYSSYVLLNLFLTDSCESFAVSQENGKEILTKISDGKIEPPGGLFGLSTTYFRFSDGIPAGKTRLYVLRFTAKKAGENSFYLSWEALAPDGTQSQFESRDYKFKVIKAAPNS